jgi:gamma-glutamyl phosphate reductase
MRRKVEKAVPEMVRMREALEDMAESLGSDVIKEWTVMAERWEANVNALNPFETIRKDQHLANVRAELAAEASEREKAGTEDVGAFKGDMHITEMLSMGLQLEELQ